VATRTFGFVSLLMTLVIIGFAWSQQAKDSASPSSLGPRGDGAKVAAAFSLQQAAPSMELWRSTNGTYVGATLPPSNGVTVVRADAASFCLQAGLPPDVQHIVGPGGNAPVDGPC
jgi:hypothetical protein